MLPSAIGRRLGAKAGPHEGLVRDVVPAAAAAPPGCHHHEARPSWRAAAARVQGDTL